MFRHMFSNGPTVYSINKVGEVVTNYGQKIFYPVPIRYKKGMRRTKRESESPALSALTSALRKARPKKHLCLEFLQPPDTNSVHFFELPLGVGAENAPNSTTKKGDQKVDELSAHEHELSSFAG